MNKTVETETVEAYCDSTLPFNEAKKRRNLEFRASEPVSVLEAARIMALAVPEGYNEFNASTLHLLPVDAQVWLAREGSVCIYVDTAAKSLKAIGRRMLADEVDRMSGQWRLWWD